ncbi:hypothetical protein H312_03436 [Anncaliia algerae PRA339]|uniref:Uncharacterized protein n=1 Tax=Anncaliia algerae PRA339 TaxID=1288291 RepID=A0A059EVX7_9MICR|nr:hypothetical protein H312_03436 [Anncaliia algerae PRA339]
MLIINNIYLFLIYYYFKNICMIERIYEFLKIIKKSKNK